MSCSLLVFDNSAEAAPGGPIRPPVLLLEMSMGKILSPDPADPKQLAGIPEWAKPVLEAAIRLQELRSRPWWARLDRVLPIEHHRSVTLGSCDEAQVHP
jgi:hypothetical protein